MLLQAIISACLETLEDFSIGSFNLPVALRVCNGSTTDLDAKVIAVLLKRVAGELGPVVGDDFVQDPKPTDDRHDKLDCILLVDLNHRGCFWPLGELVDGDI
jgi:hypothetical protein